jgi:hypothetical protein
LVHGACYGRHPVEHNEQRAVLGLWRPPELAPTGPALDQGPDSIDDEPDEPIVAAADGVPATDASTVAQPAGILDEAATSDAVEIDRIVPTSGNLGVCGQQFWLGPQRAGRTLTLWIDTTTVHLSIDGQHLKTPPSRLTSIDLTRLRAQGARPAGPPPARPSWTQLTAGAPVEIQRTVNATGTVSIAGKYHSVGQQFAGRRVTLPLETTLAHVVLDGVLTRTIPLTLTPTQRARLQGARTPGPAPLIDQRPTRVQRTVSCRGGTQIIGQRVQVGRAPSFDEKSGEPHLDKAGFLSVSGGPLPRSVPVHTGPSTDRQHQRPLHHLGANHDNHNGLNRGDNTGNNTGDGPGGRRGHV